MVVMTNADNGSILAEALIHRGSLRLAGLAAVSATELIAQGADLASGFRHKAAITIGDVARIAEYGPPEVSVSAWFRAGLFAALFVFVAAPLSPSNSRKDLSRRRPRRRRDHA